MNPAGDVILRLRSEKVDLQKRLKRNWELTRTLLHATNEVMTYLANLGLPAHATQETKDELARVTAKVLLVTTALAAEIATWKPCGTCGVEHQGPCPPWAN